MFSFFIKTVLARGSLPSHTQFRIHLPPSVDTLRTTTVSPSLDRPACEHGGLSPFLGVFFELFHWYLWESAHSPGHARIQRSIFPGDCHWGLPLVSVCLVDPCHGSWVSWVGEVCFRLSDRYRACIHPSALIRHFVSEGRACGTPMRRRKQNLMPNILM